MAENNVFCELCACELGENPCTKCIRIGFRCEGTCTCCQSHRRKHTSQPPDPDKHDESLGNKCICKICQRRCQLCVDMGIECDGSCECCVEWRKAQTSIAQNAYQQSKTKEESACGVSYSYSEPAAEDFCDHCVCIRGEMPCVACVEMDFNCPGTCTCCQSSRKEEAPEESPKKD